MIFIDWLTIYQEFPGLELPVLGDQMIVYTDLLTGEVKKERVIAYQHEGSHDTNILIQWHNHRLYVSGNPSAFGRPDNLFGLTSVMQCVDVYNSILRGLGYPEFHESENTELRAMPIQSSGKYHRPGAVITRIDLTCNFNTAHAERSLRYLSSLTHRGQSGYLYPNGLTCDWHGDKGGKGAKSGSKRLYFKYYAKWFDIQKKIDKLKRKKRYDIDPELDKQMDYLIQVLEYCQENQIVRHEVSLKSNYLKDMGLDRIGAWNMTKIIELSENYQLHRRQQITINKPDDAFERLLDAGFTTRRARNLATTYKLWLHGEIMHYEKNPVYTKSEYYRLRNDLLLIGVDIAQQVNVTTLPIQLEKIELTASKVPQFYRTAA